MHDRLLAGTVLAGTVFAGTVLAAVCLFAACRSAGPHPSEPGGSFENTIRWSTASEVDNFGFDVYRAESEEGAFVRINPEIIEGAGTTDEPRYYEFVDSSIDPYTAYYYFVESISMSGAREKFTPVAAVPPKAHGAAKDPGSAVPRKKN
jgi:hypothetical protein